MKHSLFRIPSSGYLDGLFLREIPEKPGKMNKNRFSLIFCFFGTECASVLFQGSYVPADTDISVSQL